jgi:hypothetical protein
MTDWSAALESAFQAHRKFAGSSGSSGSQNDFAIPNKQMDGAQARISALGRSGSVVPTRTTDTTPWSAAVPDGRSENLNQHHTATKADTTGTTGTTKNSSTSEGPLEAEIIAWLDQHPAPSKAGWCCWCDCAEPDGAMVVPFGTVSGTHAWLHSECWPAWQLDRRNQARHALQADAGRAG